MNKDLKEMFIDALFLLFCGITGVVCMVLVIAIDSIPITFGVIALTMLVFYFVVKLVSLIKK